MTALPFHTLVTDGWDDYRLIDCGMGRKLEKVGPYTIDRPEPQAMGPKRLPAQAWADADAVFSGERGDETDDGRWKYKDGKPLPNWAVTYKGVSFTGALTNFRHVGYFPEQAPHWDWMAAKLKPGQKLLNLFAYTGAASLIAAKAGAQVTHVDSSKKSITWAKENQALSKLPGDSIRWICEDARKFVAREVRRGSQYDGILLDPPKFGRGVENEVWNLFDDLPALLTDIAQILAPEKSFMILTSYAIRASHLAFYELCRDILGPAFSYESGELAVRERTNGGNGRLIGTSMYCHAQRGA